MPNEAKGKTHQRRSPDQWRALIEKQAHSGLSQQGFCEAQGVALSSFCSAKRRLGSLSEATLDAGFVPVDIGLGRDINWQMEVALGETITLRFYRRWCGA